MANFRIAVTLTAVVCLLFALNALFLAQNDPALRKGWEIFESHSPGYDDEASVAGDEYLLGVGKADITGYVCDGIVCDEKDSTANQLRI
jgi:hypothetical protein